MQLYFVYLLTSSQDVSCHPEGGQTADHGPPPQARHELWEVGEDNRDRPANPAGGGWEKNISTVWHTSFHLKMSAVWTHIQINVSNKIHVPTQCRWWTSAAGRARTREPGWPERQTCRWPSGRQSRPYGDPSGLPSIPTSTHRSSCLGNRNRSLTVTVINSGDSEWNKQA